MPKSINLTFLESDSLAVFQQRKKKDSRFISILFQALKRPGANWVSKEHSQLLEKALSILGPEDMSRLDVQTVLSVIKQSALFESFQLNTILIRAIMKGNLLLVERLIEMGAQVNGCENDQNQIPLFCACEQNQVKIAFLLLNKGASATQLNDYGDSILLFAARTNSIELFYALIEKGAPIDLPNQDGMTPLFSATLDQNIEMVQTLLNKGANVHTVLNGTKETPLLAAVCSQNKKLVELLLSGKESQKSLTVKDASGRLPIHYAADFESLEIFNLLKQAGSPIEFSLTWNTYRSCRDGQTFLFFLYSKGEHSVVLQIIQEAIAQQSLLELDLLPELLYKSIASKDDKLALLLVQNGVTDSYRDSNGDTAFLLTEPSGNEKLIALFPSNLKTPYTNEVLLTKRLSHVLGIKGSIVLEGQKIQLEGAWMNSMCKVITESLATYQSLYLSGKEVLLTDEDFHTMIKLFKQSTQSFSAQEICNFIQTQSVTLVKAEIYRHAMMFVFFKDEHGVAYMGLVNRGLAPFMESYTIKVWNIDLSLLTDKVIEEILKQKDEPKKSKSLLFFYKKLPHMLSSSSTGKAFQNKQCKLLGILSPSIQKVGNCAFASQVGAVRLVWTLLAQARSKKPLSSDLVQRAKRETKMWSWFTKIYNYQYYLDHHQPQFGDELIKKAQKRIEFLTQKNQQKKIFIPQLPMTGLEPALYD